MSHEQCTGAPLFGWGIDAVHTSSPWVQVILEGAVEPLVACLANKRKSAQLQSTAAAALLDIARQSPAQASRILDAGEG